MNMSVVRINVLDSIQVHAAMNQKSPSCSDKFNPIKDANEHSIQWPELTLNISFMFNRHEQSLVCVHALGFLAVHVSVMSATKSV